MKAAAEILFVFSGESSKSWQEYTPYALGRMNGVGLRLISLGASFTSFLRAALGSRDDVVPARGFEFRLPVTSKSRRPTETHRVLFTSLRFWDSYRPATCLGVVRLDLALACATFTPRFAKKRFNNLELAPLQQARLRSDILYGVTVVTPRWHAMPEDVQPVVCQMVRQAYRDKGFPVNGSLVAV